MDYEALNHHSCLHFCFGRNSTGADGIVPDSGSDHNYPKKFGNPCQAGLVTDDPRQEDFYNLLQAGDVHDDNGQDRYCLLD